MLRRKAVILKPFLPRVAREPFCFEKLHVTPIRHYEL
jgi:hypothetical protein